MIKKNVFSWKVFLFVGLSLFLPGLSVAEEEFPVDFSGDHLEYREGGKVVLGRGNVEVEYKGMKLKADRVKFDMEKRIIFAEGNVALSEQGETSYEKSLVYDLKTGKGTMDEARIFLNPWFCRGDRMEKTAENEYLLEKGTFTTDDPARFPEPHYRFVANRMKIYPGKRFWAYNVVFYVRNIPLAYFPIYKRSLKKVPYGFILWPVGHDSKKGWFALSHYNWYVNPQLRGRVYLDYIERLGIGKGFDASYRLGPGGRTGKGYIYGYFIDEKELLWDEQEGKWLNPHDPEITDRWKLHIRHRQKLSKDTVGLLRVDKFSDADFNSDYEDEERWKGFTREYLENQSPEGSLSVTRNRPDYTVQLYVKKRINDFVGVIPEKLPEVTFDLNKQKLGDSSFYWDFDSGMVYFHEAPEGNEDAQVSSHLELSRPSRLAWLRLEPALGGQGFWYSEDSSGDRNRWMANYETRLGMNTTLYSPVFKLGKMQMRHLIQPRLTYHYSPEPAKASNTLFSFNDRLPTERDYFNLALVNRLIGKGAGGTKRDLAAFTLSTKFYRNKEFLGRGHHAWGDLIADLKLNPMERISFEGEANYDVNTGWLNKFSTSFGWTEKGGRNKYRYRDRFEGLGWVDKKWKISLGTEYYDPQGSPTNFDTIVSAEGLINPKWKVQVYERYDWIGDEALGINRHNEEWKIGLTRNLHHWDGQIFVQRKWRQDSKDEIGIFIAFRLKPVSPIPLEIPLN